MKKCPSEIIVNVKQHQNRSMRKRLQRSKLGLMRSCLITWHHSTRKKVRQYVTELDDGVRVWRNREVSRKGELERWDGEAGRRDSKYEIKPRPEMRSGSKIRRTVLLKARRSLLLKSRCMVLLVSRRSLWLKTGRMSREGCVLLKPRIEGGRLKESDWRRENEEGRSKKEC